MDNGNHQNICAIESIFLFFFISWSMYGQNSSGTHISVYEKNEFISQGPSSEDKSWDSDGTYA